MSRGISSNLVLYVLNTEILYDEYHGHYFSMPILIKFSVWVYRAGLKAGDVIVAIDGLPITNAQQVYAAAENRDELTITIIRRGQRITISGIRTEKV